MCSTAQSADVFAFNFERLEIAGDPFAVERLQVPLGCKQSEIETNTIDFS